MDQFADIENEIILVEVEMIIQPIEDVLSLRLLEVDSIIREAITHGLFTSKQYCEFKDIERLCESGNDPVKVNRLISRCKKKVVNQISILEQVLGCVSHLIKNDLTVHIETINKKITELTFDNRRISGFVKSEVMNYKQYLSTKRVQYEDVYIAFENSMKTLHECLISLD